MSAKRSGRSITLSREEARAFLVSHLGLSQVRPERGAAGVRAMLEALRCVQLDPLDPMGTNADLVALARVDGASRGSICEHTLPGHAFEHFAKERCLLPASAFPQYRDQTRTGRAEVRWWRTDERLERLSPQLVRSVLDEIAARGPIAASALEDRGKVAPLDWSGWRGTARASSMAIEVLWTRCEIVLAGRREREKLWDVPARALPSVHQAPAELPFDRWAIASRVEAAGLLSRAAGASWSMLAPLRGTPLIDEMIADQTILEVAIEGSSRRYLAPPSLRAFRPRAPDDRMRILGPLDPLLWDRDLVRHVFGFEYVWEVYKPEAQRRWGWYVVPLLHRGDLVGRLEGHIEDRVLVIDRLFREEGRDLDEHALDQALARHAIACGCEGVKRAARARKKRARKQQS